MANDFAEALSMPWRVKSSKIGYQDAEGIFNVIRSVIVFQPSSCYILIQDMENAAAKIQIVYSMKRDSESCIP